MFAPQAAVFDQLVVPPWIEPRRRESLPEYAARLAETVEVRPGVPLVLGGVSLGGMVAYEMARYLHPAGLALIGTCRTRQGLDRFRPLAPLARRLPGAAFALARWLAPAAVRVASDWPPEVQTLCVDMFRRADPAFMRWALGAIFDWQPSPPPDVPTFQIHGRHDRVISASRVKADRMIEDGTHLINLTHPVEVNAFIAAAVERLKLEE